MPVSASQSSRIRSFAPWMVALALSAVPAVPVAQADENQRWISDEVEVVVRSGRSVRNAIVGSPRSGSAVELVDSDPESGYSLVRLPGGTEGWILSRYLSASPPARSRLPEIESRLESVRQENTELRERLERLRIERDESQRVLAEVRGEAQSVGEELAELYEVSGNAVHIAEQNRLLRERFSSAQERVQVLEHERERNDARAQRRWFLAGAGVLGIGILLGLVLPRLRVRRRSRWNEL